MPDPQDVELPGSNFVANNVFSKFEFADFSWYIRHRSTHLGMIDKFRDGSAQPFGNTLSGVRVVLSDELAKPD